MSFMFEYRIEGADGTVHTGTIILSKRMTEEEALSAVDTEKQLQEIVNGDYQVLEFRMPQCWGCRENQPNQQAHMDYGGCLTQDE